MTGVSSPVKTAFLAPGAFAAMFASPALANRDIVPDNMGFAELVQIFRTSAMHQPTFNTKHRCSLAHECATVEFAVRENGRWGGFLHLSRQLSPRRHLVHYPSGRATRTFVIAKRLGV